MKLILNALTKLVAGFIIITLLLFLPAGTLAYYNAWMLVVLLFLPITLLGCVLIVKSPSLLEKRLKTKEEIGTQKTVVGISALIFICGFVSAGLDFRFDITNVPSEAVIAASVVFLTGYIMYAEVMRENAYLSRSVEIQDEQKVVDTGLYSVVRHPMYTSTILMFLSIPLILDSFISLLFFLPYPVLIAFRIKSEEELLERELQGYSDYKKHVKYKLIPFIW